MSFLQHRRLATEEHKEAMPRFRLGEKDKHRNARTQDEISTYFHSARHDFDEVDKNTTCRIVEKEQRQSEPNPRDLRTYPLHNQRLQPAGASTYQPKGQSIEFIRSKPSPAKSMRTRGQRSALWSDAVQDTATKGSERTSTYLTWSESAVSPRTGAISQSRRVKRTHRPSATPSAIRRSIDDSGIYHGTGILRAEDDKPQSNILKVRIRKHGQSVPIMAGESDQSSPILGSSTGSEDKASESSGYQDERTRLHQCQELVMENNQSGCSNAVGALGNASHTPAGKALEADKVINTTDLQLISSIEVSKLAENDQQQAEVFRLVDLPDVPGVSRKEMAQKAYVGRKRRAREGRVKAGPTHDVHLESMEYGSHMEGSPGKSVPQPLGGGGTETNMFPSEHQPENMTISNLPAVATAKLYRASHLGIGDYHTQTHEVERPGSIDYGAGNVTAYKLDPTGVQRRVTVMSRKDPPPKEDPRGTVDSIHWLGAGSSAFDGRLIDKETWINKAITPMKVWPTSSLYIDTKPLYDEHNDLGLNPSTEKDFAEGRLLNCAPCWSHPPYAAKDEYPVEDGSIAGDYGASLIFYPETCPAESYHDVELVDEQVAIEEDQYVLEQPQLIMHDRRQPGYGHYYAMPVSNIDADRELVMIPKTGPIRSCYVEKNEDVVPPVDEEREQHWHIPFSGFSRPHRLY